MKLDMDIYTDGACSGNPGPGGWAAVLLWNGCERGICGRKYATTNNEMELTALYEALKLINNNGMHLRIYTDSKYVCECISKKWVFSWIKTGQIRKRPNAELWLNVVEQLNRFTYTFHWVKGHAGNKYNEMCDRMAVQQRDLAKMEVK